MNSPASQITNLLPSRRSLRMVQRNLLVYKHIWLVIVSGFFEPLFYLLSIGIGLGAMVPDIEGVSYRAFVVPGLLAANCMNGAVTDGFFNIFFKLHFQKTYDGILATPMRVPDVAFGEMLWAVIRGSLYAVTFLIVVLLLGAVNGPPMLRSPWTVLTLPAAILVSGAFSAGGLCLTTVLRKIQDFDIVIGLVVMPMFLFSGTFFPVSEFPVWLQWVIRATPLYNAVELLRQLTTGAIRPTILLHVLYLLLLGGVALTIAFRRMERALIK